MLTSLRSRESSETFDRRVCHCIAIAPRCDRDACSRQIPGLFVTANVTVTPGPASSAQITEQFVVQPSPLTAIGGLTRLRLSNFQSFGEVPRRSPARSSCRQRGGATSVRRRRRMGSEVAAAPSACATAIVRAVAHDRPRPGSTGTNDGERSCTRGRNPERGIRTGVQVGRQATCDPLPAPGGGRIRVGVHRSPHRRRHPPRRRICSA
jgi:hypothetical protein